MSDVLERGEWRVTEVVGADTVGAEGAGFAQSSEEKTKGRYCCCLQLPHGGCRWDEAKHFSEMHTERMRSSGPKLKLRKFWLETRKKKKSEHDIFTGTRAQRGGGISILGDIQNSTGRISEQHHLTLKLTRLWREAWTFRGLLWLNLLHDSVKNLE